jgi:site-specific DNA-methyltransferase (adenine-specific)
MDINRIYEGDCLDQFGQLPGESVQLTFADSPFNVGKPYLATSDRKPSSDYLEWCRAWLTEMVRVTKPSGSIVVHHIPYWLKYLGCILDGIAHFRRWIVWDSMGMPYNTSLNLSHYGLLYYAKSQRCHKTYELRGRHRKCRACGENVRDYGGKTPHPFGPFLSDCWADIPRVRHRKYRDDHPCQLPLHLLERIILMTTDEGDLVLDPFVGTGTTGIAAKRLGRNYLGFESCPEYVRIARQKVEEEQIVSKLASVWVSYQPGTSKIVTIRNVDWPGLKEHLALVRSASP